MPFRQDISIAVERLYNFGADLGRTVAACSRETVKDVHCLAIDMEDQGAKIAVAVGRLPGYARRTAECGCPHMALIANG